MVSEKIQILSSEDIELMLKRMTYQVMEFFYDAPNHIYIVGIQTGGMHIARALDQLLHKECDTPTSLISLEIDKDSARSEVQVAGEIPHDAHILLVDDVANSGRTLAYSLPYLLSTRPRAIKIAVLVDRKHKRFPVTADIVGKKLSTNLSEVVQVEFDKKDKPVAAYLTD